MGITPSTLCCHHHHHSQRGHASDRNNKEPEKARNRKCLCPDAASLFCPASPLEPVKPEPLLSRVHLLVGCSSIEEHNRKIKHALHVVESLHGSEGLWAMGLEYRRIYCLEHQGLACSNKGSSPSLDDLSNTLGEEDEPDTIDDMTPATSSLLDPIKGRTTTPETEPSVESSSILPMKISQPTLATMPSPVEISNDVDSDVASQDVSSQGPADDDFDENAITYSVPLRRGESDKEEIRSTSSVIGTGDHLTVAESVWEEFSQVDVKYCINCRRKLVHVESGAVLDNDNRADFIADGIMYERVAQLCQEVAQDAMCEDYDLEWTHVAPASHHGERSEIRALVSKPKEEDGETKSGTTGALFIVTGRGSVKAGIFSRKALVCGEGLEVGSAWHLLREASFRRLRVIMPDPNCRGDRWGYDVVRQTLRKLWPEDKNEDIYMVIHSAGGSNVQRFLLDTPDTAQTHLPQIQAMALTDSTHNLQWCKNAPEWREFWESDRCIYFKSAQLMRDAVGSRWYLHAAGTPIQTDSFWQHRFGRIQTCNAGTDVHAMTNWFSHQPIWKHLDKYWKARNVPSQ